MDQLLIKQLPLQAMKLALVKYQFGLHFHLVKPKTNISRVIGRGAIKGEVGHMND
jgi:hypothetical protein